MISLSNMIQIHREKWMYFTSILTMKGLVNYQLILNNIKLYLNDFENIYVNLFIYNPINSINECTELSDLKLILYFQQLKYLKYSICFKIFFSDGNRST